MHQCGVDLGDLAHGNGFHDVRITGPQCGCPGCPVRNELHIHALGFRPPAPVAVEAVQPRRRGAVH
jgi:hypothetical protein